MVKLKRRELADEAARRNREQTARPGSALRQARIRRRLTQRDVGLAVDVARSTVSAIESGRGGSHVLDTWQRLGLAVGRPLRIELERDSLEETADGGHLAMQELVLRVGRRAGYLGKFELSTRPADPSRSVDVGLRDDQRRRLVLVECWNTFGDIGASARSSERKLSEAAALAIALGGERPHVVSGCWVVRDSRRNRALVARYPEVFAACLPGSSAQWVRALTEGGPVPPLPGLVWCDGRAQRVLAWRRRRP